MKINKSKVPNTIKPKKNMSTAVVVAVIIVVVFISTVFGLRKVLATESYYVLNADVGAKVQITPNLLTEVVTAKGTSPKNAITLAEVRQGTIYTKYPLKLGDVLSASNTGLNLDSSVGIPEDWVVTSFNISADNAVGGNIVRGDYFDIIGINVEEGSKYLFHNVLALERNYSAPTNKTTEDGKVVPIGETLQYVVGMPAEDAALLHHSLERYEEIRLVLSPASLKYKERDVANLTGLFLQTLETEPVDLYQGTDNSFTPVLRDDNGRPVTHANCDLGIISPESLCDQLPEKKEEPNNINSDIEDVNENSQNVDMGEITTQETNENTQTTDINTSEQPVETNSVSSN